MKTETKKQAKSAAKNAVKMQREILSTEQDINNVFTVSKVVSPMMQTHFVNMETEQHGIASLITEILTDADAIFPANYNETLKSHYNGHDFRKIALASAMFTKDILNEVQNRFTAGTSRYPLKTIETYLSVFMVRSGKIGKLKLSKVEDKDNRPKDWSKPRAKWFLIQGEE